MTGNSEMTERLLRSVSEGIINVEDLETLYIRAKRTNDADLMKWCGVVAEHRVVLLKWKLQKCLNIAHPDEKRRVKVVKVQSDKSSKAERRSRVAALTMALELAGAAGQGIIPQFADPDPMWESFRESTMDLFAQYTDMVESHALNLTEGAEEGGGDE